MDMNVAFPLYVFEKDDWSMFLVENPDRIFYHVEPIDFENDEYLFWDAHGRGVRLTLERGTLTNVEETRTEITIQEAFARYSHSLGVTVDTEGALAEVWARLQANVKPPSLRDRIIRNAIGVGCSAVVLTVLAFGLILVVGVVRAILKR